MLEIRNPEAPFTVQSADMHVCITRARTFGCSGVRRDTSWRASSFAKSAKVTTERRGAAKCVKGELRWTGEHATGLRDRNGFLKLRCEKEEEEGEKRDDALATLPSVQ